MKRGTTQGKAQAPGRSLDPVVGGLYDGVPLCKRAVTLLKSVGISTRKQAFDDQWLWEHGNPYTGQVFPCGPKTKKAVVEWMGFKTVGELNRKNRELEKIRDAVRVLEDAGYSCAPNTQAEGRASRTLPRLVGGTMEDKR